MKKILVLMIALLTLVGCSTQTDLEVPEIPKGPNPLVTMTLESGDIVEIELYPEIAPNTVASFVSLIESGFYDGLTFHRVIPGFMVQGGDPSGNGTGGPGYAIKGEFTNNGFTNDLAHDRGVLSMARARDMDSAGSQFFIMHENSPHLDKDYAAFGKVIKNIEAIDKLVAVPTGANDMPVEKQVIKSMTVDTHGLEYPQPIVIK